MRNDVALRRSKMRADIRFLLILEIGWLCRRVIIVKEASKCLTKQRVILGFLFWFLIAKSLKSSGVIFPQIIMIIIQHELENHSWWTQLVEFTVAKVRLINGLQMLRNGNQHELNTTVALTKLFMGLIACKLTDYEAWISSSSRCWELTNTMCTEDWCVDAGGAAQ